MIQPGPDNPWHRRRERRGTPRVDPLHTARLDAIYALARASELHDPDTGNHVLRIRGVVQNLALRLGYSTDDAEAVGHDAMLHDVGKLRVPPAILCKPGELTEDELRLMREHTTHGAAILAGRPSLRRAAIIARHHHEHFDGTGYPDGLAGVAIPEAARITSVADVLDALCSQRAYKAAWSLDAALGEIDAQAGRQLDPQVVEALCCCCNAGELRMIYA